jgi:hypothetical protein
MNGRFQMQGGKNWILPQVMNANRFFWDSHWQEIWSKHLCPSIKPNGGSVAMDSVGYTQVFRSVYIARTLLLIPSSTTLPPARTWIRKLCKLRAGTFFTALARKSPIMGLSVNIFQAIARNN